MRNTTTGGNSSYNSFGLNVCPHDGCLCTNLGVMCEKCLRNPNNTCCNNYPLI